MNLRFYPDHKILECSLSNVIKDIPADCVVRNELNGRRPNPEKIPSEEVVYAITADRYHKYPVMPRTFPRGVWSVFKPLPRPDDEYLSPFFIPTEAEQYLNVWALDEEGGYDHETDQRVLDLGYGIHFSTSRTTVGCIRIYSEEDLLWLVSNYFRETQAGHAVQLAA